MKQLRAVAVFLALVGTAHATNQDVYTKLLNKVAPKIEDLLARFKPGMACASRNSPDPGTYAGVLVRTYGDQVRCGRPTFWDDGATQAIFICDDYIVLGR